MHGPARCPKYSDPPAASRAICSVGVGGVSVWVVGCRVQGAGCRVQDAGCRVQGAWSRVEGAGCIVQGGGWRRIEEAGTVPEPRARSAQLGVGVLNPKT